MFAWERFKICKRLHHSIFPSPSFWKRENKILYCFKTKFRSQNVLLKVSFVEFSGICLSSVSSQTPPNLLRLRSLFPSQSAGKVLVARKVAKSAKHLVKSQCLLCLLWTNVETWQPHWPGGKGPTPSVCIKGSFKSKKNTRTLFSGD